MVLLLDAYHLGDPLFLTGLARDLAARGGESQAGGPQAGGPQTGGPLTGGAVLVHGSGERGERALESLGVMPTAEDGAWTTATDEEAAAVERATRALGREIAHELNEAGVAAVRVVGADRGLLKLSEGGVAAGKTAWLRTLMDQGVVAVVASLVAPAGGGGAGTALVEVDPAAAVRALAAVLEETAVVLLKKGIPSVQEPVSISNPAIRTALGDAPGAGRIVASGVAATAVQRAALRQPGAPEGVEVGP